MSTIVEQQKRLVRLAYPCVLCHNRVFNVQKLIKTHLVLSHGLNFLKKSAQIDRSSDHQYQFQADDQFDDEFGERRLGCPICVFHCAEHETEALRSHFLNDHPYDEFDEEEEFHDTSQEPAREDDESIPNQESEEEDDEANQEQEKLLVLSYIISRLYDISDYFKKTMEYTV